MRKALLALGLALLATAATASALVDAIESGLTDDRFYVEDGVDAPATEMEELVQRFPGFLFVALADEVDGGAEGLAEELLNRVGSGTVVVLTPGEVSAISSDYDNTSMEAAFDSTPFGGSYVEDFAAFATELSGQEPAPVETTDGIGWIPILIGVGIVGLVGFAIWRGNRQGKRAKENLLTEARTEIRQQMDVIASQIVELADDPRVDSAAGAREHYRQASETFQAAEARLAAASTLPALEDLSDDLDHARWQLDATQALVDGKTPPPQPQPEASSSCFFDPTHGAGREQATLETSAGNKVVMVCDQCAEKLRRGENPTPRQIPYDNRPIPAPQAPRSHGGQGMDWLDIFSVIVGGMGSSRSYDWSQTTRLPTPRRPSLPPLGSSRSRGSVSGSRASGSRGKASGSRSRR